MGTCFTTYANRVVEIQRVITNDFGILSNNEPSLKAWKFKRVHEIPKEISPTIYWQCFARANITVELDELGYSEDIENKKENYSLISITAVDHNGNVHEYVMRRAWPISVYLKRFNDWLALMKSEKHVCIAGSYEDVEEVSHDKKTYKKYLWQFEKIKTKKGCASYFLDKNCYFGYEKYLTS